MRKPRSILGGKPTQFAAKLLELLSLLHAAGFSTTNAIVTPSSPARYESPVRKDLRDLVKPAALFFFAVGVSVLAWRLRLLDRLPELQEWIRSFGAAGPLVFLVLSMLCITLAVPAVLFNLAAGALFGMAWGSFAALVGGLGGAALAFLIARYAARDAVRRSVSRHAWMRHLEERTEKYDAILIVATRILPVFPFNLVNYAWALTPVRFVPYLVWTAVGKSPNFIFFVAVGAASVEGASSGSVSPSLIWTLAILGLIMAATSIWLRSRMKASLSEPR
jgi:uncharacterized membrane protein YdjX (TVP38/TMEM64 family)